jgi:hypothetical protein
VKAQSVILVAIKWSLHFQPPSLALLMWFKE